MLQVTQPEEMVYGNASTPPGSVEQEGVSGDDSQGRFSKKRRAYIGFVLGIGGACIALAVILHCPLSNTEAKSSGAVFMSENSTLPVSRPDLNNFLHSCILCIEVLQCLLPSLELIQDGQVSQEASQDLDTGGATRTGENPYFNNSDKVADTVSGVSTGIVSTLNEAAKQAVADVEGVATGGEGAATDVVTGCSPANGPQLKVMVEGKSRSIISLLYACLQCRTCLQCLFLLKVSPSGYRIVTTCSVISLRRGVTYRMKEEAVVSRRVTVLGQPLANIVMYGRPANRVFRVVDGAVLDLRFVTLRVGAPGIITPVLIVVTGGAVLVQGGQGEILQRCCTSPLPCGSYRIVVVALIILVVTTQ